MKAEDDPRPDQDLIRAQTRLRSFCLSLPEATEVQTWGDPTYRVRHKIFAMEKGAGTEAWCKGLPGAQEALVRSDPGCFFVPPYVGSKGWIGVRLGTIMDWEEFEDLIEQSYRMVAPKRLAALLDRPDSGK